VKSQDGVSVQGLPGNGLPAEDMLTILPGGISRPWQSRSENLTTQITYKIFQDLFNLNEKYISTLFKAEYNITPSRYVGELRLNMAKNLMQNNPELRVKDVAELVGFTDYFYFSRVFKSHEGVTPSQYIKVLMQDDVFRDFEKIPPLVEFSLQKSRNSCYTYKK